MVMISVIIISISRFCNGFCETKSPAEAGLRQSGVVFEVYLPASFLA